MAHYVVAGCAGFIASRVSAKLLDQGHRVIGIDDLCPAYDVRMKLWRLRQLEGREGFSFHRLDVADRSAMEALGRGLPEVAAVFNLAARAGVRQSVAIPHVYVETNVTGTLNLLEICRRNNIPRFLLASTSSLYGARNPIPYSEEASTDAPLSPYAASKKGAEAMCHSYRHLFGINVAIPRYFTVYGPAGRPDMSAFRFVQWISEGRPVTVYGDGSQKRDFTYVDDIADGTIAAGQSVEGLEVVNLGSDSPVVLIDAIRTIEAALGQKADLRFEPAHRADVAATWANIDKAQKLLGWTPRVNFTQGIANLVAWYRENRSWARDVETAEPAPERAVSPADVPG